MMHVSSPKPFIVFAAIIVLLIIGLAAYYIVPRQTPAADSDEKSSVSLEKPNAEKTPAEAYVGQIATVKDGFRVKVPGGWRASISTDSSFLAIQFARPGQLESLVYDRGAAPRIDNDGIPAWGGLTEHFYIRRITDASQKFNPNSHDEVTAEMMTFDDGTDGQRYEFYINWVV